MTKHTYKEMEEGEFRDWFNDSVKKLEAKGAKMIMPTSKFYCDIKYITEEYEGYIIATKVKEQVLVYHIYNKHE